MTPTSSRRFCLAATLIALALGPSVNLFAESPSSSTVQIISLPTGVLPAGIAFDGENVWVTDFNTNDLMKVRASDGEILGRYGGTGAPSRIASDGADVWVGSYIGNLYKVRTSDGVIEQTVALGTSPLGDVLFDGTSIWVAGWGGGGGNLLYKIRPSDGVILGKFIVGYSAYGLAFDGANIWVTNNADNTVSKVQASDGKVLLTVPAGNSPWAIVYDGDGIWIGNSYSGTLTHLSASDGAILGTIPAGQNPQVLGFDGQSVWSGNWYPNNFVQRFRPRNPARQQLFREGQNPTGILFDGTSVWISYYNTGILCKITPAK